MKRRLAAIIILTITVLTFSGCYPTEKRIENDKPNNTSESEHSVGTQDGASESEHSVDTHFEFSKDNLVVDFDFPDVPAELPSKIKLKEKKFDHGEMIELFFGGEAPVSEYLYGANKEYGQYASADGAELIIKDNSVSYCSGKISVMNAVEGLKAPVDYFGIVNLCEEFNRDLYSIGSDEIEGFPLQDALTDVQELISKLGLEGFGEPEVYSFPLATYEKIKSMESEKYLFNEEYPLTNENEIYYFVFPRLIGEVELSDLSGMDIKDLANDRNATTESASLIVGLAKDGIFCFDIEAAYETEVEILSADPVKYDFNHAFSELKKYLENAYFSDSKRAVINSAKIFYSPAEINEAGTMDFTPLWSFEGYYRDMPFDTELGIEDRRDYRLFVNSDVGVVREYRR